MPLNKLEKPVWMVLDTATSLFYSQKHTWADITQAMSLSSQTAAEGVCSILSAKHVDSAVVVEVKLLITRALTPPVNANPACHEQVEQYMAERDKEVLTTALGDVASAPSVRHNWHKCNPNAV